MKKLDITLLIIMLLAGSFVLSSCSDDAEFSLDKRAESIATVTEVTEDGVSSFNVGDSTRLVVISNGIPGIKPNYSRVRINYTPLGWLENRKGYYIKLNGMRDILTKNILYVDEDVLAGMANDPVSVNALSISDGYLNVQFSFPYGGQAVHEVNLCSQIAMKTIAGRTEITLDFRHNANKDSDRWIKSELVCFNLRSLVADNLTANINVLNLKIRFNTPDGEKTYDLKYTIKQ